MEDDTLGSQRFAAGKVPALTNSIHFASTKARAGKVRASEAWLCVGVVKIPCKMQLPTVERSASFAADVQGVAPLSLHPENENVYEVQKPTAASQRSSH
jgi:hypothetical protein